jgi:hypothetical protein
VNLNYPAARRIERAGGEARRRGVAGAQHEALIITRGINQLRVGLANARAKRRWFTKVERGAGDRSDLPVGICLSSVGKKVCDGMVTT